MQRTKKPGLLVATNNPGKVREFKTLLSGLPAKFTWLARQGITHEVEETGSSFFENAVLKATTYSRISRLLTLAEDSGLQVDALGGAPGILSARFAGPEATDQERNEIVLHKLVNVPWEQRTARFRAVVAVASPLGSLVTAEGIVEGYIALAPAGHHGFGYDPLFYIPAFEKTMAELDPDVKNSISHRTRAIEAIRPRLELLLRESVV